MDFQPGNKRSEKEREGRDVTKVSAMAMGSPLEAVRPGLSSSKNSSHIVGPQSVG